MTLQKQALKYIEQLCLVYENGNKKDLANAQKIIDSIYRFAHCVQKSHSCYHVHDDWRKELKQQKWEI